MSFMSKISSMKIAYVNSHFPFGGTTEAFIEPEIRELVSAGHELLLIPAVYLRNSIQPEGLDEAPLEFQANAFITDAYLYRGINLANPIKLIRLLRANSSDELREAVRVSLQTRSPHLTFLKYIRPALFVSDNRFSGVQHVHAYWATLAVDAYSISHRLKTGFSFTVHRYDMVKNPFIVAMAERAKFIRFISHTNLTYVRENYPGIDLSRAHVLHLGVQVPDDRPQRHYPEERKKIVCIGSFRPIKGHIYLLEAMKILKGKRQDLKLVLIGDGELRKQLQRFVADNKLENQVEFKGAIDHELLMLFLKNDPEIAAVIMPSVDLGPGKHEGVPVSLMEAMSLGIPVIATKTGGIPELVDESCGLLVEDKNAEVLAEAIDRLTSDAKMWEEFSRSGYEKVKKDFNVKVQTDKFISLIRSVS